MASKALSFSKELTKSLLDERFAGPRELMVALLCLCRKSLLILKTPWLPERLFELFESSRSARNLELFIFKLNRKRDSLKGLKAPVEDRSRPKLCL